MLGANLKNNTMRKFTIILIAILLSSKLFSQTYFYFPTSDAVWNYKIAGSLSYPYEWPVIDSLGQVITIGSNQYIEVYVASQGGSSVVGAIREDTIQRKIYFHNYTNEIVLYDFTLDVGDTIYYSTNLNYNLDYYKVVDSIDSTFVSGQFRKTWFLTNSYLSMTDIWIEGIGSVYRYGLLYPNDPDIVLDASNPYFGCFSHDTVIYIDDSNCTGTCPCTDWLVKVEEVNEINEDITIFPNPARNTIIVEFSNDIEAYNCLELLACNGKLIRKIDILSDRIEIDIKELNNGIYFIRLTGNEKTTLKRIIKN